MLTRQSQGIGTYAAAFFFLTAVMFFGVLVLCVTTARADTCSNLKSAFSMPDTAIVSAETMAAGTSSLQSPPPTSGPRNAPLPPATDLPAFCRIVAVLTPTDDSRIGVENLDADFRVERQNLESIANFIYQEGTYYYGDMAAARKRKYAVASTDTGHTGNRRYELGSGASGKGLSTMPGAAVHEMTVTAKAIITAYYGAKPSYSYYNGCSTGGRGNAPGSAEVPSRIMTVNPFRVGPLHDASNYRQYLENAGHAERWRERGVLPSSEQIRSGRKRGDGPLQGAQAGPH